MATTVRDHPESPRDASTGDLLRWLVDDLNVLVDKRVELVKQEAKENVREAAKGGKTLGLGVGLLLGAYVSLVVLIIALLNLFLPLWLSALITLLVFGAAGGAVSLLGKKQLPVRPLADSRETLREDAAWARRQLKPSGR